MNAAAAQLVARVVVAQLFVVALAFVVFAAGAPQLLLLDAAEARGALSTTAYVAVATEVVAVALVYVRLTRLRYVLRALALGSRAFEPEELTDLARVPQDVTRTTCGAAAAFSATTLVPALRAEGNDLATATSLFVLSLIVVTAAGLLLYIVVRNIVSGALELVPPDTARDVLALLERKDVPRRRVLVHMMAAIVLPISFVAIGAALVAHAHLRAADAQARIDTALALARGTFGAFPGALPLGGRRAALDEAFEAGYVGRIRSTAALFSTARESDGRISVTVPLEESHAVVSFAPASGLLVSPAVLLATLGVLGLAGLVGRRLGGTLADDLVLATRQVRELGNEDVLRGEAKIAGPARFEIVVDLGRAIENLADRFRIFAAAQERAIEAREATLRLRGLLFASVSHDLKSPLNAILGFCAIAANEPLEPSQIESIRIIERRARELLALIETILDAARVEAQKLTLVRNETRVADVVARAVEKGDDLGPMDAAPVEVFVDPDLPLAKWDDARVAQALAALIGHAKRLSPKGGVRVDARLRGDDVVLTVRDPSTSFPLPELARLLDASNAATAPRRLGGLALGLSLARALVALHGGRLSVERAAEGGAVFRVVLPIA